MTPAERIKARIKERNQDAMGSVEIEDWGETVYFRPMSAGDVSWMQRRHPDFLSSADMNAMLDLIVKKSLDEKGEQMFDIKDKIALKTEDVSVISTLASAIMSTRTSDQIEGN